jgi:hypothetical protein
MLRTMKRKQTMSAWGGFILLSLVVFYLVSDGDFSFIMVSGRKPSPGDDDMMLEGGSDVVGSGLCLL